MGVERRVRRSQTVGSVLRSIARGARSAGLTVEFAFDRRTARTHLPKPASMARRVVADATDAARHAGATVVQLGAAAWDGGLVMTVVDDGGARPVVERLLETESSGVATVGSYSHDASHVWALEYRWTPAVLPKHADLAAVGILLDPGRLSSARRAAGHVAD